MPETMLEGRSYVGVWGMEEGWELEEGWGRGRRGSFRPSGTAPSSPPLSSASLCPPFPRLEIWNYLIDLYFSNTVMKDNGEY